MVDDLIVYLGQAAPVTDAHRPSWDLETAEADSGLTSRELQVLALLAGKASNQGISSKHLLIRPHTAANHVRSILMKTGTANRKKAAMLAVANHWVDAGE